MTQQQAAELLDKTTELINAVGADSIIQIRQHIYMEIVIALLLVVIFFLAKRSLGGGANP